MRDEREVVEQSGKPARNWTLSAETVLTLAALGLSILSFYMSEKAQRDVANIEMIRTEYELFHNLSALWVEHPTMAHLFAVTNEAYDEKVEIIKSMHANLQDDERAKLLLEEGAIAHHLFTTYEQN